ncbi:DNA polymerase III subunit alpha [Spiroplasma culicicola]|uniref:DNA-directed DNA polymerase n=1 Tax=Spiroplasma culicicola AES-1 TaxID=1276246 RepID=W6A8A6_9MOLU|nr:DNA polymerase III subunit alpha [Spiroplasma culicicola]AHI53217.1 DNA polymerase III subunit alpha [Spiroplasma culicicola AES-1]
MEYLNLLNLQTSYNFLNSTIRPQDYINFLKRNDFKLGFYAENNTMYGVAEFLQLAKENDIKPVIGVNVDISYGRILLFAKNNLGYQNVSYISSYISNLDRYDINKIEKEIFNLNYDNNIVIFIPTIENFDNFKSKINSLFKANLFYGVTKVNYEYLKKDQNIVFANEINFLYEDDYFDFKVLRAIGEAKLLNEVDTVSKNFYFTSNQVNQYMDMNLHNQNIDLIASQIENQVIDYQAKHFLTYPNAQKMPSDSYLEKICYEKLSELNYEIDKNQYLERLNYELDVIKKMGFADYFLIVADMVNAAKEKNILVGPGRGSAAGSLVAYLLGITQPDPIKWGLLFERFLNIERVTMPDIDIDFQDDRREEVLEYLFEKYGKDHFATITTFQTIGIKNALRDCGRVFDIPNDEINQMTKQIYDGNIKDLDKALSESKILTKYQEKYPRIFGVIKNIIGLPRQTGTHAAGVVFCDIPMHQVVPTKMGINGISQTQFSMNYLEDIGLIKTDILGLRNLTTIQEVLKIIQTQRNETLALEHILDRDQETFELLKTGQTSGIFQLESSGMTEVLRKMNPTSIDDIAITSSLYRPGPQENIPLYIERKNQKQADYIIDNNLEDILGYTYGIIVYQEQVMQLLQRVAGFSLSKSDIVRRAMGKKDQKLMNQFKSEFMNGALNSGYEKNKAEELWHYVEKFAEYGFNKSHAISYSIISYWMAYLKTHYKVEFYCSLLNGVLRNEVRTSQYLNELKNYGYKINGPSIKNPNKRYYFTNNTINMPLNTIKTIGPEFIKNIQTIFKTDKAVFDNILILLSQLSQFGLGEQKYNALVYSGAFDIYGYSRKELIENREAILNLANIKHTLHASELSLDIRQSKDNLEEIVAFEKEYLGFYVSSHPLSIFRKKIVNNDKLIYLSNLNKDNMTSDVLVMVENIVTKTDKNGGQMCFVDISDESASMVMTIFASTYEKIKNEIAIGKYLILKIKTQLFNNKISAILIEFKKNIK